MNKIAIIMLALFAGTSLHAQSLSPYTEYIIKKGVSIEVTDIKRVEKYGWDNLEVQYVLKNESNFDIRKLDFMIHLLDKNQKEIGTIEAHACEVTKNSEKKMSFIEVDSEYVNEQIVSFIPETIHLDVVIEDQESQIVSIKGSKSVALK